MDTFAFLTFALGGGAAVGLGILGVVVLFLLWAVGVYNSLVRSRNNYKNAFALIGVQLKRRYDPIPNLVEPVKGYRRHAWGTLEAVIQARNLAINAQKAAAQDPGNPEAMKQLNGAEGELTGALSRLMVVCEAYPDLKANQNMLELQEELTSTENKVAFARQAYNDAVTSYNNMREVFPASIVAGFGGFGPAALMEIENKEERNAPKVSF